MKALREDELLILTPEPQDNVMELQTQGEWLAAQFPAHDILLDMRHVRYGGSYVISLILTLQQETMRNGKKLISCNLSPQITKVLEICRLNRELNLCREPEEAMSLLR